MLADATLESPAETSSHEEAPADLYIERINLVDGGKRFKAWFATPGIINYSDVKGGGKELLRKPTIDKALETFIGAPLIFGHVPTTVTDFTDLENGKVDKVGFDAEKGWHYCEGPIETDQARQAIEDGWKVSSGTRILPEDYGPGGTWLNNRYDREIENLRFHHLALLKPGVQPRYEEAEIVRTNSVEGSPMKFKWIKKLLGADGTTTEQVTEISATSKLDLGEGKSANIGEAVEIVRNNAVHCIGSDDVIEHEGIRYNAGDCIKAMREKMNCTPAGHHPEERPNEASPEPASSVEPSAAQAALPAAGPEPVPATILPAPAGSQTETERQNALDAETNRLKEAAQTEAIQRSADEAKAKRDEEERLNAVRRSGLESFSQLAQAREQPAPVISGLMTGSREHQRERGRKLFGSGQN